jgi:predicted DCC family thiol-disulfide oxidoreductase YuxK
MKSTVLFDGECALCQGSVRLLRRLDWLRRFHYQDARGEGPLPKAAMPLHRNAMLAEMHLVTANTGKVFRGFFAFRWMAWRLPLTAAFAWVLYMPGVPWLGRRLYRWVARNRFNLVPCHNGACSIPPKR